MDKKRTGFLTLILVFCLLISLFPVRFDFHYWDEAVYLQHAEIISGETEDTYNELDFRPPLLSAVLGVLYLFFPSEAAAHVLISFLSVSGVLLTFILGREMFDELTGLLAAAIFGLSPLLVQLSHDILVDTVLVVPWLLTAICLWGAIETEKSSYYALAGFATGLAVLAKFTSLVLLPVVLVLIFVNRVAGKSYNVQTFAYEAKAMILDKKLYLYALVFVLTLTPYLIWVYLNYGAVLHSFIVALEVSGAATPFFTYLLSPHRYILIPFWIGLVIFIAKIKSVEKRKTFFLLTFFLALYLPLQFYIENRELRYLLPVIPFVAVILSRGFTVLEEDYKKYYKHLIVLTVLLSLFMLPGQIEERNIFEEGLYVDHWNPPVQEAAEWMKTETSEDAVLYTNHRFPELAYYSDREIVLLNSHQPYFDDSRNLSVLNISEDRTQPIEKPIEPGYIFFEKESPHNWPSEDLIQDEYIHLNETFNGMKILFYEGDE